jgi:predicted metal-binding protein
MQPVSPKWQRSGLVLVCERCSKERIPEEAPEVAARVGDFDLRGWLKGELKASGDWGRLRVVSSSCLDVCAKGCVTICFEPSEGEAEVLVVDPLDDREAVLRKIQSM